MIGKILSIDNIKYRVIGFSAGLFAMIQMGTGEFRMLYVKADELSQKLRNAIWAEAPETPLVVDVNRLPESEQEKMRVKKEIIMQVEKEYGPMYESFGSKERKPGIERLMEQYGVTRPTIRNTVRTYLQSGMNDASLVNRNLVMNTRANCSYHYTKKTGRKPTIGLPNTVIVTDEVKEQFKAAIKRYRSGTELDLINAYSWLRDTYYATWLPNGELQYAPETEIPTLNQFYYFAAKIMSKEEKDACRTSIVEQRNNKRLLLSSSRIDAIRPGWILEVDAVEADIDIINPETNTTIGRPVVYFAIDVKTSVIVAASISLENNSLLGLTNLFINLADDKQKIAEACGLSFDPYLWPSNFLPHEIRCDRGADFKSNEFGTICKNLGITRTLEPGAMGSMKGLVEQSFHMFQQSFRASLKDHGLITNRYDSNHKKTAVMSLEDFTKLTYGYVITHNQTPLQDYPCDKAIIDAKIITAPCALWEYFCKESGTPRPISQASIDHYWYNIMPEMSVSLSRKGAIYKELRYINSDPDLLVRLYNLGRKREKMIVHYDPRDVGTLYYLRDGKLEMLNLNRDIPGNADFEGLTWAEYEEYLKKKKELRKQGETIKLDIRSFRRRAFSSIVADADIRISPNTHHMRENRNKVKNDSNYNNRIAPRITADSIPALSEMTSGNTLAELLEDHTKPMPAQALEPVEMSDKEAISLFF